MPPLVQLRAHNGGPKTTCDPNVRLTEMKRMAVPNHSNLFNIVAMRFIAQEREERDRLFVARMRGLASVCEPSIQCTRSESPKYCRRNEHGRSPNADARKKSCPAWDNECSKCSKKGHPKKCCQSKITAESHKLGLCKMKAGIANLQKRFRSNIKHAKKKEIVAFGQGLI